jgi:hypothetical protein
MNRTTLARRYAPLVAVVAIQLLIIALAPSTAPNRVAAGTGSGLGSGGELGTGGEGGVVGDGGVTGGGTTTGGGTSGGEVIGGGGGTTGGGTSGGGTGGGGPTGDTSHCVSGRQYDPKIYAFAAPCTAKFKGANGGKTAPLGVDGKTIKVIVMRGNYGVAVNAALTAAGSLPGDDEFDGFLNAASAFINSHYELYGRKVVFKRYNIQHGTGGQGKPDDQGLRQEMDTMVQNESPFAVIWSTSVSSATFDELSDLGVVNLGGYGFTDSFNQQHAPYHWDVQLGGNQLAQHAADWWCKRMYGNGAAKAQYAGTLRTNDNLATHNRQLGVISTNDQENVASVKQFDSLVKAKCGAAASYGNHFYFYDQDVSTADQQRQAAVSKMIQDPPATSVMCFCDQVAPFFLYDQEEKQQYYPENIFVGTGFTDLDSSVQTYDHQLSPQRAKDQYPEMENAFGLAQMGKQRAPEKNDAAAVWHAVGKSGDPYDTADAQGDWDYYAMLATMIQAAGPNLNATTVMQGSQRLPALVAGGGTDQYNPGRRSFGPGDFTWNDSMREVYWSPTGKSDYNGVTGVWRSLNNGKWFGRGEYPAVLVSLPPKPRA